VPNPCQGSHLGVLRSAALVVLGVGLCLPPTARTAARLAAGVVTVAAPIPTPIGTGARYHPLPSGAAVEDAKPVAGMACSRRSRDRFGVHLELFANQLVVLVPAGIGVAPPRRTRGPYVLGGRCSYPVRTREPTGVAEIKQGRNLRLGQFFALWGQPLSSVQLAGFRASGQGRVLAFVGGRPWRGDPRQIPLRRHSQIVLEIGGFVPPHARYRFRKGL
jgi:hypothetical protein